MAKMLSDGNNTRFPAGIRALWEKLADFRGKRAFGRPG
jgi:hypothetical protein